MDVPPIVAALLCVVAIVSVLLLVHWLARPHTAMYVEINRRCAVARAAAAERALVYDQTPASPPPGGGSVAAGAGTPDSAPAAASQRVHVEFGRHRKAA